MEVTMDRLPVNKVVVGDCMEVMKGWPQESVDLVVTSPPYWGLRDYGVETVRVWGGLPGCEHEWGEAVISSGRSGGTKSSTLGEKSGGHAISNEGIVRSITRSFHDETKSNFCVKCGAWRGSLGLEPHPQLFIDHLVEIFREVKRILKPSGTFWLNLGDTYCGSWGNYGKREGKQRPRNSKAFKRKGKTPKELRPPQSNITKKGWLQPKQKLMIPSRVAIALQADGWILRSDIIWHKPNHMPSSVKDRLTCAYEHVFLFAKQRRYYFDLDAIRKPHKVAKLRFPDRKIDYKHKDGPELRGLSGAASRQYFQTETATAWNPLGKNPGDVWETKDEKLTKHDIAVGRIGNFSYTDPLHTKEYHPKGKNPGDLWFISTQPFKGAHFAVFPSALIEPIVKAGCPRWICSRCGKPRTRIIEKRGYVEHPQREGRNVKAVQFSKEENKYVSGGTLGLVSQEETVGWSDCGCGEKWVGGVVLDPFAGSGTALRVARKLGRRFIGIEINPEYAAMARQRVRGRYKPVLDGATKLTDISEVEK